MVPCLGLQAMCEMLTIVGKKLEEVTKDKKRLEGYFAILEKWSKSKARCLPSLLSPLEITVASLAAVLKPRYCASTFSRHV